MFVKQSIFAAMLLMIACSAFAVGDHAADRKAIAQSYAVSDAAYNRGDVDAMLVTLADPLIEYGKDGKKTVITHDNQRADAQDLLAKIHDGKMKTTIQSVAFGNGGATVLETNRLVGEARLKGQVVHIAVVATTRDFLVKQSSGVWLQTKSWLINTGYTVLPDNSEPLGSH